MMEPAYREAMRGFASGVAIIACGEGQGRSGCAATAIASLSLDPPSLLVNLRRASETARRIPEVGAFSVNFLRASQEELARRFSSSIHGAERFGQGAWRSGITGAPVLEDALSLVECRLEEALERHTHVILIGRAMYARGGAGQALLHFRSEYLTI